MKKRKHASDDRHDDRGTEAHPHGRCEPCGLDDARLARRVLGLRENDDLKTAIRRFYESERPTAALCHGVSALLDVTLANGSYLVDGKTMTGFANVEEDAADAAVGQRVMPWRVEDAARERGANYVEGGLWKPFAVRDGRLITGQQRYSGRKVAELVIQAVGT